MSEDPSGTLEIPLHHTLDQLALLATIRGDVADAAVFAEASALVRTHGIDSDANLGPLVYESPEGIGAGVLKQLRYMYDAGGWVLRESAVADLPADLRWLYESGAVTLEQLGPLVQSLDAMAVADLVSAIHRHAVRDLPGFDAAIEAAVLEALPGVRKTIPRIPLGRALTIADPLLAAIRKAGVSAPTLVGSLRRGHDTAGDIEIVAPADEAQPVFDEIAQMSDIRLLHRGSRRMYILTDRVQVGVRCPRPEEAGAALLHLTGSRGHFEALRALAASRGWTLEREGLTRGPGSALIAESEEAIYAGLDLPWIPPEIRNADEAILAAQAGTLPTLIARTDIRGDLHMHSNWSDGRDSIEDMVRACIGLGYEYMAITDHSQHSAASRNLSVEGVSKQADEIAALREKYPAITILHGCEVDILASGKLDFADKVLERFDIVLASLHDDAGHQPDQLFQRYAGAMQHPLVSIITHPTNRQMPHRAGYDLEYERLFSMAAETATVVEIDGAPSHLDLNGVLARKATAAGATISIDSDSHRAELLDRQMGLGVLMARNGWVEKRQVLNTRPIDEIRTLIAAKRKA